MFILIILSIFIVSNEANTVSKCLDTEQFTTKIVRTDELFGEWSMAHIQPISKEGFICPAPKLKVIPVTSDDITYWKDKCLHKLDISLLDETKFELQVTFPKDFETKFSIIRRDKNEDHILFPSCKFEKIEFVSKGDVKMWIATREEDGKRLPIAVTGPSLGDSKCIINNDDKLYYFFC